MDAQLPRPSLAPLEDALLTIRGNELLDLLDDNVVSKTIIAFMLYLTMAQLFTLPIVIILVRLLIFIWSARI